MLSPPVRAGLDLMADGCALVRSATRQGILLVTVAPSFAGNWLVARLPRFNERQPDIDVRISATHDLIDFSPTTPTSVSAPATAIGKATFGSIA